MASAAAANVLGIRCRVSAIRLSSTYILWGEDSSFPPTSMIPLYLEHAVACTNTTSWLGLSSHVAKSKSDWCLSTRPFQQKYANAKAENSQQNGSHELAEATLPKTIALATKNHGPIMNPNAPTRSAQIRGERKQEEMSINASRISSHEKKMRSCQI